MKARNRQARTQTFTNKLYKNPAGLSILRARFIFAAARQICYNSGVSEERGLKEKQTRLKYTVFFVYCAVMLILLFFRDPYDPAVPYWEQITSNYNLIPFATIRVQLRCLSSGRSWLRWYGYSNLLGNIILFIPLGFLLPFVFPRMRSPVKTLLAVAAAITLVEIVQLFTLRGYADIDDLILNLLGAAIGYCIFVIVRKRKA